MCTTIAAYLPERTRLSPFFYWLHSENGDFQLELSGFDVSAWKNKQLAFNPGLPAAKETATEDDDDENRDGPVLNSLASYARLGLVVAVIIAQLLHSVLVKEVVTDLLLKPGSYTSRCGLAGYLPGKASLPDALFSCEDEFLRVNTDGTAEVLDSELKPIMLLKGGVCGTGDNNANDDDDCVDGLVMKGSDGTLVLGGKPVKQVLIRNKSDRDRKLSPWPFAAEPAKLKYKVAPKTVFVESSSK